LFEVNNNQRGESNEYFAEMFGNITARILRFLFVPHFVLFSFYKLSKCSDRKRKIVDNGL